MLNAEMVTVEGKNFQLLPMKLMEARKWDFKIVRIIAPMLGALEGLSKSGESTEKSAEDTDEAAPSQAESLGFAQVATCIQKALSTLSDDEMDALIRGMFTNVTYLPEGGSPVLLNQTGALDAAFAGVGPYAIYRLIFEVARFNKFTPFVLAGGGSPLGGIQGLLNPATRGMKLDRLVAST